MQKNPQEALIEFQDLRAINPSYPGLSASIYRAEIAAGLRLPPPDPAALSRSRELYNNAYDIVRRNLRAQFPLALEYLEAAIKLNPDNAEAVSLKDRINRDAGGGVTVVLSSAAMEQYRQAENLYLQQRYLEAGIIIDRLLQDPRYARNPQLLELKNSIEARK
jgi:tetratricopeptide (TPR) repeat protein